MDCAQTSIVEVDAIAREALSERSLLRYMDYKASLLVEGHDEESLVSTLSILVWELSNEEVAAVQRMSF